MGRFLLNQMSFMLHRPGDQISQSSCFRNLKRWNTAADVIEGRPFASTREAGLPEYHKLSTALQVSNASSGLKTQPAYLPRSTRPFLEPLNARSRNCPSHNNQHRHTLLSISTSIFIYSLFLISTTWPHCYRPRTYLKTAPEIPFFSSSIFSFSTLLCLFSVRQFP